MTSRALAIAAFDTRRDQRARAKQDAVGQIEAGMRVWIGGEMFDVGAYVPEIKAWDLIQDGCRAVTVRADILISIAESWRLPRHL